MKKSTPLLFHLAFFALHPAVAQENNAPLFSGRVEKLQSGATALYWPGTSISTSFTGTSLKAVLKDDSGKNQYRIIVDGQFIRDLQPGTGLTTYILADSLPQGIHTITLHRQTDWFNGRTLFYRFEYEGNSQATVVKPKHRRIIFYGNSITVGAGMRERDSTYKSPSTNNYMSYSALTARHFEADYHCIASSGIGLLISWGSVTMPEIYGRLNPADSASRWNFAQDDPDVVVINLLQNDAALLQLPQHPQFIRRFGNKPPSPHEIVMAYTAFIQQIRKHYPRAHLICALGSMDATKQGSPWPGYIRQAVNSLHDPKIHTHFFPYIGGNGHPNAAEHQAMSQSLIKCIEQHVQWRKPAR